MEEFICTGKRCLKFLYVMTAIGVLLLSLQFAVPGGSFSSSFWITNFLMFAFIANSKWFVETPNNPRYSGYDPNAIVVKYYKYVLLLSVLGASIVIMVGRSLFVKADTQIILLEMAIYVCLCLVAIILFKSRLEHLKNKSIF